MIFFGWRIHFLFAFNAFRRFNVGCAGQPQRDKREIRMLERLANQLALDLELEPLKFDDQRKTEFVLTPHITISMREFDSALYFFSPILLCPKAKREELFMSLMKANFLGQGTLGATIGLDSEEKYLTLSLTLPYDLNQRAFKESVEDFANILDFWREEIKRLEQGSSEGIFKLK